MTSRYAQVRRNQKTRATCRNRRLLTESLTGAEAKGLLKGVVFDELAVSVGSLHQILLKNEGENRLAE